MPSKSLVHWPEAFDTDSASRRGFKTGRHFIARGQSCLRLIQSRESCHVQVSQGFKRQYNNSQNHFLLIREVEDSKPPRFDEAMDTLRMGVCLVALFAMVGLSASGVLDLLPASVIAVLLIVSTKVSDV